jgi:holo-[acyl-carrier protein] synthase
MTQGIGVDIIEIGRIEKIIERDPRFCDKIFTPAEIAYCEAKHTRAQHYAARFAAKEAFLKAMGTGLRGEMSWLDITIDNDSLGKPFIRLTGHTAELFTKGGRQQVLLSLSHAKEFAVAFVLVE